MLTVSEACVSIPPTSPVGGLADGIEIPPETALSALSEALPAAIGRLRIAAGELRARADATAAAAAVDEATVPEMVREDLEREVAETEVSVRAERQQMALVSGLLAKTEGEMRMLRLLRLIDWMPIPGRIGRDRQSLMRERDLAFLRADARGRKREVADAEAAAREAGDALARFRADPAPQVNARMDALRRAAAAAESDADCLRALAASLDSRAASLDAFAHEISIGLPGDPTIPFDTDLDFVAMADGAFAAALAAGLTAVRRLHAGE